jgi:hypothetical protein
MPGDLQRERPFQLLDREPWCGRAIVAPWLAESTSFAYLCSTPQLSPELSVVLRRQRDLALVL